jgi:hypothetical protein
MRPDNVWLLDRAARCWCCCCLLLPGLGDLQATRHTARQSWGRRLQLLPNSKHETPEAPMTMKIVSNTCDQNQLQSLHNAQPLRSVDPSAAELHRRASVRLKGTAWGRPACAE